MVKSFLYFQTFIQFRVPINDDGTVGTPEIVKKWTSPYKGAQHNVVKITTKDATVSIQDAVEL